MKKRKRTKKYKKKSLKKKRKKILSKKKRKKISFKKKKRLKKRKRLRKNIRILKKKKNKHLKTKAVILSLLNVNDKIKSFFSFKFDLDRSLQNFFQGISDKISEIQKLIQEEKEKQKKIKLQVIEKEKKDLRMRLISERDNEIKAKEKELKDEIKLEKERKKELQKFIRLEQAEVRKEQAEKQRKFLEQIKLEKKIDQFRKREALEIQNLEKFVLSQERESYVDVQAMIDRIKIKYQALRDQKIRERVQQLGVKIEEGDDRTVLLEKEKAYNLERQKIEFALESFYRSAHSLCFQLNKKYIPKYLSIMRVIDRRFETGEIFIKWDDTSDEDWLILIYLKNNSPETGIIIEDKTNPELNSSHEFKSNEIFRASDLMVDALTKLLDKKRGEKKAS
ncbi:MAG: hypothetical protein CBE32_000445 [Candidatus Pelagibacter sp. TMED272]|nr:hypothetical protein [Pelagibacteraceae bacterium]RPG93464.1 MAG: hypothetical protein CBE32_000445 [Candidatus Pelagibacter sp. TMED272]